MYEFPAARYSVAWQYNPRHELYTAAYSMGVLWHKQYRQKTGDAVPLRGVAQAVQTNIGDVVPLRDVAQAAVTLGTLLAVHMTGLQHCQPLCTCKAGA